MVLIVDVPVQTNEGLHVALVSREVGIRTCVVTILILHIGRNFLKIRQLGTRDVVVGILHSVLRASPTVGNSWSLGVFEVTEDEKFVLDDRSTKGKAIGGLTVGSTCSADLFALNGISAHILVTMIYVSGSLHGVGTRLGDSIHTSSDEVGLTYVKRRDNNLQFLDGIDRNRAAASGELIAETEVVVEVCAVNSEVGSTSVRTCKAHPVSAVRRKAGYVSDITADGRKRSNLSIVDVSHSARLCRVELCSSSRNHHLVQHLRRFAHLVVEDVGLTQRECYIVDDACLIAHVRNGNLVRTTGAHTLNRVTSVNVSNSAILGTRRHVDCQDGSTYYGFIRTVSYLTSESRCGNLGTSNCREKHQDSCQKETQVF